MDESKEIEEKFESSKKRVRDEKGKQEWVGGALLGANSEFNGQNNKLGRAWNIVWDLEKTVELSNSIKKEALEDYEAWTLELRKTIKEYQDYLSHEKLEK